MILFSIISSFFIPILILWGIWYLFKKSSGSIMPEWIRPAFIIDKKTGIVTATVLLLYHITLYNTLINSNALNKFPVLGWMIFSLGFSLLWLIVIKPKTRIDIFLLLVFVVTGSISFVRANGFIQSFSTAIQLGIFILIFLRYARGSFQFTITNFLHGIIKLPIQLFFQCISTAAFIFNKKNYGTNRFFTWIKTILLSFITAVIFIALLSAADPVFSLYVRDLREQMLGRTIATIIIGCISLALFATRIQGKDLGTKLLPFITIRDITAIVFASTGVMALFIFIQSQYLFGGSRELLVELNMTYSQYVRKGFIELLFATGIGTMLSYIYTQTSRITYEGKMPKLFYILQTLLLSSVSMLLLSAVKRNIIYMETYGLTRVRYIGNIFIGFLACLIILLLLFMLFRKISEKRIAILSAILGFASWMLIAIPNIDLIIMKNNPDHGNYTDYFYLIQMSEDAAPLWNQNVYKMIQESDMLMQKDGLSDEDKVYLTNLKLALLTVAEKRDRLYTLYAPSDWLMHNGWKIGYQLKKEEQDTFYNMSSNVIDNLIYSDWEDPKVIRVIPRALERIRTWNYKNISEQKAFNIISKDEDVYFNAVNDQIWKILLYQVKNQISLYQQEYLLLFEMKYPFISIHLNGFYPSTFQNISFSNERWNQKYLRYIRDIQKDQQFQISQLVKGCTVALPQEVEIYGILQKNTPNENKTGLQQWRLKTYGTKDTAGIIIDNPNNVKITYMTEDMSANIFPRDGSNGIVTLDDSGEIFAHLTILPKKEASGNTCSMSFTLIKAQEVMGL